jgi:hypothetical protein
VQDCLATLLPPQAIATCIDLAQSIDTLDTSGVRRLMWVAGGLELASHAA